jgi:hypothetical protein
MTATHPTPCTPFGGLRRADVNPRALRDALKGLRYVGFSDGAETVWFSARLIRRALKATLRLGAECFVDLEDRRLVLRWRDGRGGLRLRDTRLAEVQHAEGLREARAEKAARKGEPEPAPVTRIFAPAVAS